MHFAPPELGAHDLNHKTSPSRDLHVRSMRDALIEGALVSPEQRHDQVTDNTGNPIEEDIRVWVDSSVKIRRAITLAFQGHFGVMAIGSRTSGVKAFMMGDDLSKAELNGCVGLGIRETGRLPEGPDSYELEGVTYKRINVLEGKAFILESPDPDQHPHKIHTWAGVLPSDLDRVLRAHFGPGHSVFLDLTTRDSAQIGGVVVNGAEGPVRANAAFNLDQVLLIDGQGQEHLLKGDEAKMQVGLGGAAGAISEVRLDVIREYPHEYGFFLPLSGDLKEGLTQRYPKVLALLHAHTRSNASRKDRLVAESGEKMIIKGLEIITRVGMSRTSESTAVSDKGRGLAGLLSQGMTENDSEVGLMINGVADLEDDDIVEALREILHLDDDFVNQELGISMGAELFSERHMSTVRAAREGLALAARASKDKGTTLSTDFNSRIMSTDQKEIELAYELIWNVYWSYIEEFQSAVKNAQVDIYGHNHPGSQYPGGGVNPHIRVTLLRVEGETSEQYEARVRDLKNRQTQLYDELIALNGQHGIEIAPGEKGLLFNTAYLRYLKESKPEEFSAKKEYIKRYGGPTFGFRALSKMDVKQANT